VQIILLTQKKVLHIVFPKKSKVLSLLKGGITMEPIRYISDEHNNITGVIVPIDLWREIQSEKETAHLLKSETMKKRLLKAKNSKEGIPFDEACKKLGV